MTTFLVYSKKPMKFISSVKDISNIYFVKYGFNWLYLIDFLNIFYSMKRKFFVLTAILIAVYVLFTDNNNFQMVCILAVSFLGYAIESLLLKQKKYKLVATIEAKNSKQAKELFLKDYILQKNRIFVDRS